MFTCPEKDIHSLYLDNELPEQFMAEYESHIKTCEKCQARLNKLRSLRSVISADSKTMELSQKDMDDSFSRLQARLSYTKVTKPLTMKPARTSIVKDLFIGAAAAAVIAVILPVRVNNATREALAKTVAFTPVARTSLSSLPSVKVDDTLDVANISFLNDDSEVSMQARNSVAAAVMPFNTHLMAGAADGAALPIALPAAYKATESKLDLTSYDVFTPLEEAEAVNEEKKGFYLHFHSPLLSLDIGNNK